MKRHLFAFFTAAFVSLAAQAQTAPVDVVQHAVRGTVDAMKKDPAASGGDMTKIKQIVNDDFIPATDFGRTTRIAVGEAFKQATPEQQKELVDQFSKLMTATYAASLAQLGTQDAKFSFKEGTTTGNDALVTSTVTTPGDSQTVAYRLGKVGGGWKIYDIDMSGAWLIQVYQGQFKAQLQKGGVPALIDFLKKHNARTE
ncbi:ABC transporter substrate-binding protein [Paraburkholderia sp. NMBU_R16]|uniref:MlaC/ttg2D family ABC transporter substrate-binding protein n=1 Tax=Paraburkholderia sp. NMBU_R16 TaxID=2698676 RepID=UPI00156481DF|nr:ABC transporter substrate-binding protein [Paraburkholderia sp. NMBU_R16]NRO98566.1 ABC transporter substrate-binding protein [Paraburkholderia sp. NMBU_R16]